MSSITTNVDDDFFADADAARLTASMMRYHAKQKWPILVDATPEHIIYATTTMNGITIPPRFLARIATAQIESQAIGAVAT